MKSSNEDLINALKEAADRIKELEKEKQELYSKVRELEMSLDDLRAAIIR
jgi:predicted  nucleic acid-binding Zn-ribbon protein